VFKASIETGRAKMEEWTKSILIAIRGTWSHGHPR
jgi:hypothetical protein